MKESRRSFFQSDGLFLLVFICVFILIRTINFSHFFSFVYDQANFSTTALEIFRERRIQLIGPSISINYGGREIFQGGIIYYFFLFFLVLGNFDPKLSTYIFMVMSGVMIVPLYFGCKHIAGKNGAKAMVMLYTLLPMYVHGTTSLWNPHFQFALTPILIYVIGVFYSTKARRAFFVLSCIAGFLLQFHYQYIVIIAGLFIYYFFILRLSFRYVLLYILGIVVGFSPMLLFELRNGFYNLITVFLFMSHYGEIFGKGGAVSLNTHYFPSISLLFFLIVGFVLRSRSTPTYLMVLFVFLMSWSTAMFVLFPGKNKVIMKWSYEDELKAYSIIRDSKLTNFNISAFYNAKATSQKYFLKRDHIISNFDDYKSNQYLFVIYYRNEELSNLLCVVSFRNGAS